MWETYVVIPYFVVLAILILLGIRLFRASQKQMKKSPRNER